MEKVREEKSNALNLEEEVNSNLYCIGETFIQAIMFFDVFGYFAYGEMD